MSHAKYVEIENARFGGDLYSKDLKMSAGGNQWVVVTITKDEALKIAALLIDAARDWKEET